MLKQVGSLIIAFCVVSYSASALAAIGIAETQATESETQEAQEIAVQFTLRFAEAKDFTPIVKELYLDDFIERYIKSRAKNPDFNADSHLLFVPGLEENSGFLRGSSPADWQRFYIVANNFLLFGFVSGLKKVSDDARDIKPT